MSSQTWSRIKGLEAKGLGLRRVNHFLIAMPNLVMPVIGSVGQLNVANNAAVVLTPHGAPRLGDGGGGPDGTGARAVLPDADPRAGVRVRLYRMPRIEDDSILPREVDPDRDPRPTVAGPGAAVGARGPVAVRGPAAHPVPG